jgi:hypothetical protein
MRLTCPEHSHSEEGDATMTAASPLVRAHLSADQRPDKPQQTTSLTALTGAGRTAGSRETPSKSAQFDNSVKPVSCSTFGIAILAQLVQVADETGVRLASSRREVGVFFTPP